jgi:hypothetical protein
MSRWTDTEINKLESLYSLLPPESLEREFPNRSREAIRNKANGLDLSKAEGYQRAYSVNRSEPINLDKLDESMAHFICGLTSGEGYFTLNQGNSDSYRFGISLQPDDEQILHNLQNFFGCGLISSERKSGEKKLSSFRVVDLGDIVLRIIPFFDNYQLRDTLKQEQYQSWRKQVLDSVPQGVTLHKTTEQV